MAFLKNENINLLWSLLQEELQNKFDSKTLQIIHRSFVNNMELFYDFEKSRTNSLLELNKKYIISFLEYTKNLEEQGKIFQTQNQNQNQNQSMTNEQYLNEKRSSFNKDYEKKQKEFESLIKQSVPSTPTFSDNIKDDKIKDIDSVLKQMTNIRNYDIGVNINRQQKDSTKWLSSNDTSIKIEKEINKKNAEKEILKNLQPIETRQIKIYDDIIDNSIIENGIIDLDKQYSKSSPKNERIKQVSWGIDVTHDVQDSEEHSIHTKEDFNLFKKFKTIQKQEEPTIQQQIDILNEKVNKILEILQVSLSLPK
jgi:hypothetical protein